MAIRAIQLGLAVVGAAALTACDQPKWREKPAANTAAGAAAPASAVEAPTARVIPVVAGPTPAQPAWAEALVGKTLRDVFPNTGVCKGNTDIVQQTYSGDPAGVQIHGWGWDLGKKARVQRVVLVDRDFKIVAGGESGAPRPDVVQYSPDIKDPNTGWNADLARTSGPVDAYGVVGDGKAICPLGHLEF